MRMPGPFRPAVEALEPRNCPAPLLPDLHVLEGYLHDWYLIQSGGQTFLRLSTSMANGGLGPFELRGTGDTIPDPDDPDHELELVNQRIYDPDAPNGYTDVLAGTFEYHETHGHTHFSDFAQNVLWAVNPDGSVGDVVATGDKTSFCMLDIVHYSDSLPNSPNQPSYQVCSKTRQGISVGWADVYPGTVSGQAIDITGVPSGQYWLGVIADPENHIQETDDGNNTTRILINLVTPAPAGLRVRAVNVIGATDGPVPWVRVTFNKAVQLGSFTPADVSFTGPGGTIAVSAIEKVKGSGGTRFRIHFDEQAPAGTYVMQVGPNISDRGGSLMDQNNNGTTAEAEDHFLNIFAVTSPRIIAVKPADGATLTGPLQKITVTFSKAIDLATFSGDDVTLLDPLDQAVPIGSVERVAGSAGKVFVIRFTAQTAIGTYELTIGPNINDRSGNVLDQNSNGVPGEAEDVLAASYEIV